MLRKLTLRSKKWNITKQLRSHSYPCHTPFLSTLLPCSRSNDYPVFEKHSLTFIILACLCSLWKWKNNTIVFFCVWLGFPLLNVCLWDSSSVVTSYKSSTVISVYYSTVQLPHDLCIYSAIDICLSSCYFKAIKNDVVDRHTEQWNRTKSPESRPLHMVKCSLKSIQWEKVSL